ncbi:MAG: hypothetical protein KDA63_16180 [Planctomycetales bacterium]|nr:hypothetical protein [Planctomycetales bacterium]
MRKQAVCLLVMSMVCACSDSALALPVIETNFCSRNADGTYWFTITPTATEGEVSFLEFWITVEYGAMNQVDGGSFYDVISPSPWAPSVVFTSDQILASALNPEYAAQADLDTVIDDTWWPGKVLVELEPHTGDGSTDGEQAIHVAMTSFTGGVGGPLPGRTIPLVRITAKNHAYALITISGVLQSESDPDGHFLWTSPLCPEPSSGLIALAVVPVIAVRTRRR